MSQEKVDRYKNEKANRKETIKREKRNAFVTKLSVGVVLFAIVGWLGYSAYGVVQGKLPEKVVSVNVDSVNNYLSEVDANLE